MKLRNKKTGDIGNLVPTKDMKIFRVVDDEWNLIAEYDTLAKLNEEWEDYEEPETDFYFYIDDYGCVQEDYALCRGLKMRKEIGNYFETKEEAEKAVEKLKAWKRLRDKGFQFESWFGGSKDISFWLDAEIDEDIAKDLDLLFGGEK